MGVAIPNKDLEELKGSANIFIYSHSRVAIPNKDLEELKVFIIIIVIANLGVAIPNKDLEELKVKKALGRMLTGIRLQSLIRI